MRRTAPHKAASTLAPASKVTAAVTVAIASASLSEIGSGTGAPARSIQIWNVPPAFSPCGACRIPVWASPDRSLQVAAVQSGALRVESDPIVGEACS